MSRLTPGDMPHQSPIQAIRGKEDGFTEDGLVEDLPDQVVKEMTEGLEKLREPFPPDQIEKLPKPIRKGAWEGGRSQRCHICHGYHVIEDSIHLDYVGHANTTNRILNVDPFWEWEPLAYTDAGLPLFDKVGGLWIKLTICGVTRLGYGDGANPKEIIGDAIRNAAMRFGVALDLWSKIDLHAERNPGDGQTSDRQVRQRNVASAEGVGTQGAEEVHKPTDTPPAPNQDALDALGDVCDENGFDRRTMREAYADWAKSKRYRDTDLLVAHRDRIYKFAEHLLEGVDPGRGDDGGADTSDEAQAAQPGSDESGGDKPGMAQAGGQESGDPTDTSDVEKREGEAF